MLVALVLEGCVANHDLLAERDGTGGTTAHFGSDGSAPGGAGGSVSRDAASDTTVPAEAEPAGDRRLTLLHGVIDSPWVTFCFARVTGGKELPTSKAPLPAGGLSYGRSATLDAPGGADLTVDGLHVTVVAAASADVVAGMDCPSLLARAAELAVEPPPDAGSAGPTTDGSAGPRDAARAPVEASTPMDAFSVARDGASPAAAADARADARVPLDAASSPLVPSIPAIASIRARALPLVPEGALSAPRSYLLVAGGCLGGRGVTDPSEKSVCGEQYSASSPTLAEMLVARSRFVTSGRVGLQVLDAAPAVRRLDLRLLPGLRSDPLVIARGVVVGAVRPVPPNRASSAGEIGASTDGARIRLFADGAVDPIYDEPWASTFGASGISALEDGKSYTLVVVGPYPGFAKRRWWNDPLVSLVDN